MMPGMSREAEAKQRAENEVEFSRIVAFSDGVFSIAITLLVLELTLKAGFETNKEIWDGLWDLREKLLAYGISFAVIARFWVNHHRFFGEVKAFDGRLITLNMVYLGFVVLIPFSTQVLGEYGGHFPALVVYASNLALVVLLSFVMATDARRAGLTTTDAETHRESRERVIWIVFVFLLSIPLATVDAGLAPFCWLLLFFDPASKRRQKREGGGERPFG
jgi:uncharacterized membrane protein